MLSRMLEDGWCDSGHGSASAKEVGKVKLHKTTDT